MSRIYFHSPEGTAELRGSERAYMGNSISDWFCSTLDIPSFWVKDHPLFELLPKDCYLRDYLSGDRNNWTGFLNSLRCWVSMGDKYFVVGNYKIGLFGAQLNTAYLMGSDPVKLMARLHGQCERHCYVEGNNRQWLSEIIEKGLKTSIYRQNEGWESVIDLLQSGNSPVVTSYSVCNQFPNPHVADFQPSIDDDGDPDWDEWYDLSIDDQWQRGMRGLRLASSNRLEMSPETWANYYFSHGWDAFKLNQLLSVPSSEWNDIAKLFSESQLPATEAWEVALGRSIAHH